MGKEVCITRLKSKLTGTSSIQLQRPLAIPQNLPSGVLPYFEEEPSIKEWLFSFKPHRRSIIDYLVGLFPFTSWLKRYNVHWLLGDAIAGG